MLQFRPVSSSPSLRQVAAPGAAPDPIPPAPIVDMPIIPASVGTFGSGAGLGALIGALMASLAPRSSRPKWVGIGMLSLGGLLAIAAFVPALGVSNKIRQPAALVGGAAASLGAIELVISSKKR